MGVSEEADRCIAAAVSGEKTKSMHIKIKQNPRCKFQNV